MRSVVGWVLKSLFMITVALNINRIFRHVEAILILKSHLAISVSESFAITIIIIIMLFSHKEEIVSCKV